VIEFIHLLEGSINMKKTLAFIVTSIALASAPFALAQQNVPPATGQTPSSSTTPAMPGTPATRAQPAANRTSNSAMHETMTKDMADMQKQMTAMSTEMTKIKATRDDGERQKMVEAHMTAMEDTMESMQGMMTHMLQMHASNGAAVRTSSTAP
jgi:hypothetical protein